MTNMTGFTPAPVRMIDIVFPGDANHRATLFGGGALSLMDKAASLTASRHAHAAFVTAACDRVDFRAPAPVGDIVEAIGRVVRVGYSSLDVEVELFAERPVSGARTLCTRGRFLMVAGRDDGLALPLPAITSAPPAMEEPGLVRMTDIVFPPQTSHQRTLHGGAALAMMGKAAFVAATRHARAVMVMAASDRIDFRSPIREGEIVELVARVVRAGRSSVEVRVDLVGEHIATGARHHAAVTKFTMVAVDEDGRSIPIDTHGLTRRAA